MIDHVSLQVADLKRSAAFYGALLTPLGYTQFAASENSIGYGKRYPELWLNLRQGAPRAPVDTGAHVCLRVQTEGAVQQFHATALAAGGVSDGAPGTRQGAATSYYGAFVRDLDGNRLEAATFPTQPEAGGASHVAI